MDSYNLRMRGNFITEKVLSLPTWSLKDAGRIIYVETVDRYFIGARSLSEDSDGWIPIGFYPNCITKEYINWDTDLQGGNKISSKNIPTLYLDTTTDIQTAIEDITDNIALLSNGTILLDNSIKARHIGFNSKDILIDNSNLYFTGLNPSVQDALDELFLKTADKIKLSPNTNFGSIFGLQNIISIESALVSLEEYLSQYPSNNIIVNDPSINSDVSLKMCLDNLYGLIKSLKFTDLIDTPSTYGLQNQFIITDGNDKILFTDLYGNLINVQYPYNTPTTLQNALNSIRTELDNIVTGTPIDPISRDITTIEAKNVLYDDSASSGMNNVDDVLDFLLLHGYSSNRPPTATNVTCSGIGTTTNVQAALEHLQEYLNQAIGLIPSCLKASDIYYNSVKGHVDVDASLDYLFDRNTLLETLQECCDSNKSSISKHKVYFTSYQVDAIYSPCGGFPVSLTFDFTNWYEDYKLNYNPNVGDNFIVVPIVQITSFVIPNAYQKYKCDSWSNPDPNDPLYPGECTTDPYESAVHTTWPPKPTLTSIDYYEAGTMGEYSYVYYHAGPVSYLDNHKKWKFTIEVGSRAYSYGKRDFSKTETQRNSEADRSYSTGGDIQYNILFFGFGTDENSLVKVLDSYCVTPCIADFGCSKTRSEPIPITLTIDFQGTGSGTVTGIGQNIDFKCTGDCSKTYSAGTKIKLTAYQSTDSTFVNWEGDATINGAVADVVLDVSKTLKVTFNKAGYIVAVSKSPIDGGTVISDDGKINCGLTCSYEYSPNSSISLSSSPASGYVFDKWVVDGTETTTNPLPLTIKSSKNITAIFKTGSIPTYNCYFFKKTADKDYWLSQNPAYGMAKDDCMSWDISYDSTGGVDGGVTIQAGSYLWPASQRSSAFSPADSWVYDDSILSPTLTKNQFAYTALIVNYNGVYDPSSILRLKKYSLQTHFSSSSHDDDGISFVAAFLREGNKNYHLSFFITAGEIPSSTNNAVVYNAGASDMWVVNSKTYTSLYPNSAGKNGWQQGGYITVRVVRENNIITFQSSNWNSETLNPSSKITVDLNSDIRLHRFLNGALIGFGAFSQRDQRYFNNEIYTCYYAYNCQTRQGYIHDINTWTWNTTSTTPYNYFGREVIIVNLKGEFFKVTQSGVEIL